MISMALGKRIQSVPERNEDETSRGEPPMPVARLRHIEDGLEVHPTSPMREADLILTMPQRYARILNGHFGNRLLPFPLKVPAFDSYLYWHANADADPANMWLRQKLLHALRGGEPSASQRR
jgi:hypothetical protein